VTDSDAIRARFGAAAAAAFPDVAAWDLAVIHTEGRLAWVEVGPQMFFPVCHVFVDGAWRTLEGLEAFRHALIEARPPLADWQPIIAAYTWITGSNRLTERADVEDLQDPRWHVMPWSDEVVAVWEPPHFDRHVLRFCVNERGALAVVSVREESYVVEVSRH